VDVAATSWENLAGPLIAGAVALVVFWLTAFVGEDYRRSRDAKALAAALAGEVESFKLAMALAEKTARSLLEVLANGQPVPPRMISEPPETVYAANLERVGILGVSIGRDLPYAYHMVHAYRVAMTAALSANTVGEQKSGIWWRKCASPMPMTCFRVFWQHCKHALGKDGARLLREGSLHRSCSRPSHQRSRSLS